MATEKEVAAVLPRDSFVREYVKYACRQTDAPLHYHYGCALAILSALAPIELATWEFGSLAPPQMWVALVGDSRQDRKTTAIRIAEGIIDEVRPEVKVLAPGSAPGFIEGLAQQNPQLIIYGELGSFLQMTRPQSYAADIRTRFMEAFDGRAMGKQLSQDATDIPTPRLSLLAGVTPGLLEKFTDEGDWENGFMGRWFPCYAHRERNLAVSAMHVQPGIYSWLVDRGRAFADRVPGEYIGMSEEALLWWAGDPDAPPGSPEWLGWYRRATDRYNAAGANRVLRALTGGLPAMAKKVATLQAHDWGETQGRQWVLSLRAVQAGAAAAELGFDAMQMILKELSSSGYARLRRSIVEVFAGDDTPRTLGQIMRDAHPPMNKRTAVDTIESMLLSGHLHQTGTTGVLGGNDPGTAYTTTRTEAEAIKFDGTDNVINISDTLADARRRAGFT